MPTIKLGLSSGSLTKVNSGGLIVKLVTLHFSSLKREFPPKFIFTTHSMIELIKVSQNRIGDNSVNSVSARELHKVLGLAVGKIDKKRNILVLG